MQLMEHWGNMAKLALLNNKSGGCILNSLQFVNVALRHTVKFCGTRTIKGEINLHRAPGS